MTDKIKILFEEMNKKYPDIISEDFIKRITEIISESYKSELECEKNNLKKKYSKKLENKDEDDKDMDSEDEDEDDDEDSKKKFKDDDEIKEEKFNHLINTLDIFLDECSNDFINEYSEKINESIKTNIAFDVITKVQDILENYGIRVPENVETNENLKSEIKKLNSKITGLLEENASLKEQNEEKANFEIKEQAKSIVENITKDMTDEQKVKFSTLIEDYSIDDLDEFKVKVENLNSLLNFKKDKIVVKEEKVIDKIENDNNVPAYTSINKTSFTDAIIDSI